MMTLISGGYELGGGDTLSPLSATYRLRSTGASGINRNQTVVSSSGSRPSRSLHSTSLQAQCSSPPGLAHKHEAHSPSRTFLKSLERVTYNLISQQFTTHHGAPWPVSIPLGSHRLPPLALPTSCHGGPGDHLILLGSSQLPSPSTARTVSPSSVYTRKACLPNGFPLPGSGIVKRGGANTYAFTLFGFLKLPAYCLYCFCIQNKKPRRYTHGVL